MKTAWILVLSLALVGTTAAAGLKVIGEGDGKRFDPTDFPPHIQEKYTLAETKCANPNCHAFGRTVDAIMTGEGPISKLPFDKEAAKAYGVKMMRKPDSEMNKKETKSAVELLYYLIDRARKR